MMIRLAKPDELELIRELEDLAGERYADAGLPADLEGLLPEVIAEAQANDLLWVILAEGAPVGFALCWEREDALHLRELDVHPDFMGRGFGRALVEHVVEQAAQRGLRRVTLTTFRDVPFNAPLYRSWGFVDLTPSELPAFLRAIREEEGAGELRAWPRVAMAREVP